MANLLLMSQFFPPETGAAARRVGALADALAERHQVTALTLEPSYPSPGLFSEGQRIGADAQRAYPVIRTFPFRPHRKSLIARGMAELWMAARMALRAGRHPSEAVLVSTPSMFLAPAASAVARRRRATFVWDLRDLTWRYGRESAEPSGLNRALSRILEAWMVRMLLRADLIIAATEGIRHVLIQEYSVAADRVLTATNGVSREFYEAVAAGSDRGGGPPEVLYVGLLGHNHRVEVLAEVASLLPDVHFRVVGDGPLRPRLEQRRRELRVENLKMEGYVVHPERLLDYYSRADILFNHTLDAPILNATALPAKFFEYMATGKPIVYGGKGLAVDFLEGVGCGRTAPPGDARALADAIQSLISQPRQAAAMGERGRAWVGEHAIREELMASLAAEMEARFAGQWRRSNRRGILE